MEVTAEQVKKAIDDMGVAHNARMETFKTQLEEVEKHGKAFGETKARLEKIATDMAEFESIKAVPERMKLIEAQLKKLNQSKDKEGNEKPEDHKEASAAIQSFLRKGLHKDDGNAFNWEKARDDRGQVKSLSVRSDPDGGYMVTSDLSGRIVERVFETSDMRSICSVQQIGTDALEGTYDDNEATSGGWVGETEARTETNTPQIGKWVIPAEEQYAYPFTTQKMLDDASQDPEAWLARKVGDILGRTENTAFVLGTGIKKPKGIAAYASGTTLRTQVQQVNSGANGDVTYAGLVAIMMALKGRYRARARWGMARTTLAKVMALVDLYGRPLWMPSMVVGAPSMLLGLPISELNDLAAPATNSLSICCADFQEFYQIAERQGARILRNPFATMGLVGFYTTKRVGGAVINTEAGKIGKLAT